MIGPDRGGGGVADGFGASVRLAAWEGVDAGGLAVAWRVPAVHLFGSVGSTNDVARELAVGGAADGTVVIAEEQRAGRGRGGRSWSSPAGIGLWLSIVGRPAREHLQPLPIRVGVEVARALDEWAGAGATRIKWPNDLLIEGRKIAGILCEASWMGDVLDHAIVGIGINLLHGRGDFPPDLADTATSLASVSQRPVSRFEVAGAVVGALRAALAEPELDPPILDDVAARDALAGRWVEVREPETDRLIASGEAVRIAPDGGLLIRNGAGQRVISSGTVRLVPTP